MGLLYFAYKLLAAVTAAAAFVWVDATVRHSQAATEKEIQDQVKQEIKDKINELNTELGKKLISLDGLEGKVALQKSVDQIKIDLLEALKKQSPIYIEPISTGKRFEEIKSELAELQKELKATIQREREIREAEHNQRTASDQDLFQKLEAANRAKQNLSRQDLAKASLKGIDLQAAELRNSNFRETDLSQANLNSASLSKANLSKAQLSGTKLNGADLTEADLSEANLAGAELEKANLNGACSMPICGKPTWMPLS